MKFYITRLPVVFLICAEILPPLIAANDFKGPPSASKNRSAAAEAPNSRKTANKLPRSGPQNSISRRAGFGPAAQEQSCQCVLFYLCDKENVFDQPTQSERYNNFFEKYVSDYSEWGRGRGKYFKWVKLYSKR